MQKYPRQEGVILVTVDSDSMIGILLRTGDLGHCNIQEKKTVCKAAEREAPCSQPRSSAASNQEKLRRGKEILCPRAWRKTIARLTP